jgi:hypothetical protein
MFNGKQIVALFGTTLVGGVLGFFLGAVGVPLAAGFGFFVGFVILPALDN